MHQHLQNKKGLVENVFTKVYDKYDLMNDFMSLGIHRLWKKDLINWMSPSNKKKLIDMACGTGDLGKLFLQNTNFTGKVLCVDPNSNMLKKGKERLKKYKNLTWKKGYAEKILAPNNYFDYYTISFGLRNTKNINKSLKEAYRVLKTGGRFFCLEFSKIENEFLNSIYSTYSKLIPKLGKYIVGSSQPYDYLINSINSFYNQDDLLKIIKNNGFEEVEYNNLSNGIVAIHSGWKI